MRKKFFFGFLIVASVLAGFFTANHISPKAQVSAAGPDDFITTWNSGSDRVVKIPVYSANKLSGYNYTINWGDDPDSPTIQTFTDNTVPTFTYPLANTEYDITISGTFPGWTFNTNDTPLRTDVGSFAKKSLNLNSGELAPGNA